MLGFYQFEFLPMANQTISGNQNMFSGTGNVTSLQRLWSGGQGGARLSLPRHFLRVCIQEDSPMILIEGIPVLAARLAAEQKAKEWLKKTRRSASDTTKRASIERPSAAIKLPAKAA